LTDPIVTEGLPEEPTSSGVLRGATRAAALLTVAGLGGQVFTLVRELFIASQEGATPELDALLIASVAPMMLAGLIAGGTSAALVPGYIETTRTSSVEAADRLLAATLTWTTLIGIAFIGVILVGGQVAIAIAGPGLSPASRDLAIGFLPIVAPLVVFNAVGGMLAAIFQVHDRMRPVALAWLLGPVASAFITIVLWDDYGLTGLALAMTLQQVVVVGVLVLVALLLGYLPRPSLRADRTDARRFINHALPLAISSSILQLNLLTDRAVASLLAPGAVSALRYAEGVIRIPLNAIEPAWNAAIYPALVRASHLSNTRSLGEAAFGATRYVTVIFVPLSVATAAMAPLIVQIAFVRGAFDAEAAIRTSGALAGFAPLIVLTLINSVLSGAHNARRRGVFLMSMGILNTILNAVFNVGFGLLLGVAGVALSTSLTVGLIQVVKAWRLGQLTESFPLLHLLVVSAKSIVASLIVAAPIAMLAWNLPTGLGLSMSLVALVALSTVGMVGYIALGWLIGLKEPWFVIRTLTLRPIERLRRG
jgi:putative peptidoglycan lipid II flippase